MKLRAWCRAGVAVALASGAGAEELRVRLGEQGTTVMRVAGIDEAGRLQLRPESGEGGAVGLPLVEARGLQFEMSAEYRKAQQLAFAGREGEAVYLMRGLVPALVPFAGVPESNATGIVRFYFKLLRAVQAWPEAIALAATLPVGNGETDFSPEIMELARALHRVGRVAEVATVMARVEFTTARHRQLGLELADELRRGGHWREARMLYAQLGDAEKSDGDTALRLRLLQAYTDWHMGRDGRAHAVLREVTAPAQDTDNGVLYRLLQGRVALGAGDAREALDVLAAALVGIEVASEWRVELTAVIADAYRAEGQDELADGIEADLRRLHPRSRWLSAVSN